MKHCIIFPALATGLFFLVSCNNSSTAKENDKDISAFDLASSRKSIEESNKAWTENLAKGDAAGIGALYTSDARLMAPGTPAVEGREKITEYISGLINIGIRDFRPVTTSVWGNETLIGEEGTWTLNDSNGLELDHGKYLVLWKKEDGKWKIFRDCWNSDVPPPAPR